MRIAYFVPRCTFDNSHGRYVIELARRFARRHQVTVYSAAHWPGLRGDVECRVTAVVNRPMAFRLASLWLASALEVRRRSFDIVHIQGADAPTGNVVTAHCCNAARSSACKSRSPLRHINRALGVLAERRCLARRSAMRIVAVSERLRRELVTHYAIDPERITVVHNGVDTSAFFPRRLSDRNEIRARHHFATDDFVVLFVGRDVECKGFDVMLQSMDKLSTRFKLLAVGAGTNRVGRVEAQPDVDNRVVFVPPTEHIAAYYSAADCFVLPTRYDTFSLCTLEAMASGLPVIVSRAAGVCELLADGVDSVLIDSPDDVAAIADRVNQLATDETFRARLVHGARATAERHSWDGVAERIEEEYYRLT